jgi:hypothetical protein
MMTRLGLKKSWFIEPSSQQTPAGLNCRRIATDHSMFAARAASCAGREGYSPVGA